MPALSQVQLFRDTVAKVVRALSDRNITVHQRGMEAKVEYDGQGRPIHVILPSIPDAASTDLLNAIQGFLDHEVAHLLFTDFTYSAKRQLDAARKGDKLLPALWNSMEDVMIERKMSREFRGSELNLDNVQRFVIGMLQKDYDKALAQGWDDGKLMSLLLPSALRALAGHENFERFLSDKWRHFGRYTAPMLKMSSAIKAVADTKDAWVLAEQLAKILKNDSESSGGSKTDKSKKPEKPKKAEKPDNNEGDGNGEGTAEEDAESKENQSEEDQGEEGEPENGDAEEGDASPADKPESEEEEGESEPEEKEGEPESEEEGSDEKGEPDEADPEDQEDGDADGDSGEEEESEGEAGCDSSDDEGGGSDGDADEEEGGGACSGSDNEDESEGEGEAGEEPADMSDDSERSPHEEHGSEGGAQDMTPSEEKLELDPDLIVPLEELASKGISESMSEHLSDNPKDYVPFSRDYDYVGPSPLEDDCIGNSLADSEVAKSAESMCHVIQGEVERVFKARSAARWNPGQRRGKLNPVGLHRLRVGDDRVFRNKIESTSKEIAVQLVIDCSGSMWGAKVTFAATAAYMLASVLDRVGVACEVVGFSTISGPLLTKLQGVEKAKEFNKIVESNAYYGGTGRFGRYAPIGVYVFKDFSRRFDDRPKKVLGYLPAQTALMQNNCDGESLELAAARLVQRREARKIQIVMSDGQPAADGPRSMQYAKLHSAIEMITRSGVEIYGLGLMDNTVKQYYAKSEVISKAEQIPEKIMALLQRLLVG